MDNPSAPIASLPSQPEVSSLPVDLSAKALAKAGPAESSSRRWLLWLIGGVALLTFGAAIGIFSAKFLSQYQSPSQLTSTPTASPSPQSPTPFPTLDPTADWKTYAFQPLQLSLKIPSELTVHTEEPNPGNDFTAYIQNYPFNSPMPSENAYQLYIIWQKTPTITQSEFQQLQNDLDNTTIENTVIDGYPATKGQVKGERNRFVTYILKGNTKISLFTSEPTQANENLTNQILSTFRFLK